MAAVIVKSAVTVPSGGTYSHFSSLTFSTGTLTAISGVLDTTLGTFAYSTGNGINGGVPNQGPVSFALKDSTVLTVVPAGAIAGFTGLTFSTGTLTAIHGGTDFGSYPTPPMIARGLLGVATPPAYGSQMIVFVST